MTRKKRRKLEAAQDRADGLMQRYQRMPASTDKFRAARWAARAVALAATREAAAAVVKLMGTRSGHAVRAAKRHEHASRIPF